MNVYAYAAPPPDDSDRGFPVSSATVVTTATISAPTLPPSAGLAKLRERLKDALRGSDAKLDMDEVAAMVWLEGLR